MMTKRLQRLKKALLRLLHNIPTDLPKGSTAFDVWARSIFDLYDLPDDPSYRHALASQIMHLGTTEHKKPKAYFAATIKKAMANQVAYFKIQQAKQAEAEFIEKTQYKAEVTAQSQAEVTSEPKPV